MILTGSRSTPLPRDQVDPESPTLGLRIVRQATAKFQGVCCLVDGHTIGKGEKIVRVIDQEAVGVDMELGWACSRCRDKIARGL